MINTLILRHQATGNWYQFRDPVAVMTALHPGEVLPTMLAIEARCQQDNLIAAGYIGYEAAPGFDSALLVHPGGRQPLLCFGLYHRAEIFDVGALRGKQVSLAWEASLSEETYADAIHRIQNWIREGQTYQVNFTFREAAHYSGEGLDLFLHMATDAPYGALLETDDFAICSASPELFFSREGDQLVTRPMKGTAPRGRTEEEDLANRVALSVSLKDRAENTMIVDMVRNDLGKIAETGSVKVTDAFHIERYPTVWQMTTTVKARSRKPVSEILKALFPCASITGAPKVRTMQLISQLESTPREIYTGAIGMFNAQGDAQFSVAIRTAVLNKRESTVSYGVGGGIVWDSTAKAEYDESQIKALVIRQPPGKFGLFETLGWYPGEGYLLLTKHLQRLKQSANYFGFAFDPIQAEQALTQLTFGFTEQPMRVRLDLDAIGTVSLTCLELPEEKHWKLVFVDRAVNSEDIFLFHKTTRRQVYDEARQAHPEADDVILCNQRGEVTESTIANLVIRRGRNWLTPAQDCGLLPGTFRSDLLDANKVVEAVLTKEDVKQADEIFLVNSVRRWMPASLL